MSAYLEWCDDSGRANDAVGARYFTYWTDKYLWHDSGYGLIVGTCATAALVTGLQTVRRDVAWLRTPVHRWTYLAIGVGSLTLFWATAKYSLVVDLNRDSFPTCADSIGIPMMGIDFSTFVVTPIFVVAGFFVTRAFGAIPVALSCWDSQRSTYSWIVSLAAAVIIAGLAVLTYSSMTTSMYFATPAGIATIYLIAATRAALLAPKTANPPLPAGPPATS